jgi:hypothetical protein
MPHAPLQPIVTYRVLRPGVAMEVLACDHDGRRGSPSTIRLLITQGTRRRCARCATQAPDRHVSERGRDPTRF